MNEIIRYDEKRGYFAAAGAVRALLMAVRFLFMPIMTANGKGNPYSPDPMTGTARFLIPAFSTLFLSMGKILRI